jgi:hypothetical protein
VLALVEPKENANYLMLTSYGTAQTMYDGRPLEPYYTCLPKDLVAFYKWKASPVSQRDWDDAHLINAAVDIHHDDPEFGYRFITDELAEKGVVASRNRVNRR